MLTGNLPLSELVSSAVPGTAAFSSGDPMSRTNRTTRGFRSRPVFDHEHGRLSRWARGGAAERSWRPRPGGRRAESPAAVRPQVPALQMIAARGHTERSLSLSRTPGRTRRLGTMAARVLGQRWRVAEFTVVW